MEQTILTPSQSIVLELAQKEPNITDWFYFTGGTALAEFYLKHRLSEDLDFFTRSQVNVAHTDAFVAACMQKLSAKELKKKPISGLMMYSLTLPDSSILKIDFNEYDFPEVEKGKRAGNLWIDSLYDISVNKLNTVLSRSKARDFVDLYFCLEAEGCSLEQLFDRVLDKFDVTFEETTIVNQFNKIQDLTDYPTMLVPFDKNKMIDFFLAEAKKLEPRIFK